MEDLLNTVTRCAELAQEHRCTSECVYGNLDHNRTLYAEGDPPEGYWESFQELAASQGYTLSRDDFPYSIGGPGTQGFTVGIMEGAESYLAMGLRPFSIHTLEGLSPATEFTVLAHELTHVLLKHPAENRGQLMEQAMRRNGSRETSPEEVQSHLSAIAVAKKAGLEIRQSAICYLTRRIRTLVSDTEKHGALLAARKICEVL